MAEQLSGHNPTLCKGPLVMTGEDPLGGLDPCVAHKLMKQL